MILRRRSRRTARRTQAGFTLIELMVALVLFSFAIAGVLSVAVSMSNGFREQRMAVDTESSARAAMEFLGDAVRGASPGVATGLIGVDATCTTVAFEVVNDNAGPDELIVTYASGSVVTATTAAHVQGDTDLHVEDFAELQDGDQLLVSDYALGTLVTIAGAVTNGDLTVSGSTGCASGAKTYGSGSLVVRVQRARFYVDPNFDGLGPMLMMDPDYDGPQAAEPLAEGIEDMQIAIARDDEIPTDGINEVGAAGNDDDWSYNVSGDVEPLTAPIRAVRITLVAKAREPLTGAATFRRPAAEDHPQGASLDNYRRRTLTSIVEIRNLGGSP